MYFLLVQGVNGYNRAALAEAVFDVEHELFNEGTKSCLHLTMVLSYYHGVMLCVNV